MKKIVKESIILDKDDLTSFIEKSCKKKSQCKTGIEYEKFAFHTNNLEPLTYKGENGIETLLKSIQKEWGWLPVMESENIIGLTDPEKGCKISLEPGGQFEFSGSPHQNIHEIQKEIENYIQRLKKITRPMGIGFLGLGVNPRSALVNIPHMPKSRYKIMANYMPKVGLNGLDMMFRTCTIHVNIDFSSESDMRRKMQIGLKLQPLVAALFANSPFTENKPNNMQTWRYFIWQHTDSRRCDVPESFLSPHFGFTDYVEWALDIPMYFVIRKGIYHDLTKKTFRQFMEGKARDVLPNETATIKDWETHLSTLFPEVRLRNFLEMRGADSGSPEKISALSALWTGLTHSQTSLDTLEELTRDWRFEEIQLIRKTVPMKGLSTPFRKNTLHELSREIILIAKSGLKERAFIRNDGLDEEVYLNPINEIIETGTTNAQKLIKEWNTGWNKSIHSLFEENAF